MKRKMNLTIILSLLLTIISITNGNLNAYADEKYQPETNQDNFFLEFFEPISNDDYNNDIDFIDTFYDSEENAENINDTNDEYEYSDNEEFYANETCNINCECVCHNENPQIEDYQNFEDEYLDNSTVLDKPVTIDSEKAEDRKKAVKDLLNKILPQDKLKRIVEIKEDSDGINGVLAYVEQKDFNGKTWIMAYDPQDIDLRAQADNTLDKIEMIKSIIHEYAHIESLNETQVKHGEYEAKKDELLIKEGILKKNSYLELFTHKFWSEENIKKLTNINNNDNMPFEEYDNNPNNYVTEYAATNFVEDFAESFTEFVMNDKKTGNTIAEQKINFFYQFPELVKLREHIRNGLK